MKLFEMQRIEGRTAIWLEGSRCFLASNIYRRVSLSRILIHMPGAGWGDTELCCRFQAAEYANTSPCITVFRSYHATGKTYQFHWPHSTLQQVWMLDNVRCVCPYMWVSQNGCPLHVHESFRWIQNCDIIYGIRCTPCTWELLPKLFQIIHNFKQVIHCTETWPDRIMPGSYPLTSNILCLTCFFRSFPYLHACCIYIYTLIYICQPTKTLERLRSWAWAHCLLAIGVSIFSSTRRTPCRGKSWSQISGALVQQQKPVCSTFRRELLRIYFSTVLFSSVHSGIFDHWVNRSAKKTWNPPL